MIRLKHSEITLTPADVEETRRRMERRQAANAPATMPPRVQGPPLPHSLRARLRRGPERSCDASMEKLGHVPILQPQQAIYTSIDEPGDPPRPVRKTVTEITEAASSDLRGSPLPNQTTLDPGSAVTGLPGPFPGSEIRLPFSTSPPERDSSLLVSQEDTSETDTQSPSKVHLSPPRVGRSRTNSTDPDNDEPSPSLHQASTDGNLDTAAILQTPTQHQRRSIGQHSAHHPSLQHVHRLSPSRQGGQAHEGVITGNMLAANVQTIGATSPPLVVLGYWDSHQRYRLVESAPRTEPRPRTAQPSSRGRTMSSSSEPSHRPSVRRPDTSDSSFVEDIFWNTPAPEVPPSCDNNSTQASRDSSNDRYWSPLGSEGMGYRDSIRNAPGRHSSETSTTSQPYSFYELADSSRHSSSTCSQVDPLAHSQYDGAAPSRQVSREFSRGAYYSIRLPGSRAASGPFLRPPPPSRAPSTSSPDLATLVQHGVSPLPARPYSRVPSGQHLSIPSAGLIDVTDFVGGDQDAARAVQRDLSSPLELVQERANAHFQRISTRMQSASSSIQTGGPRPQYTEDVEEVTSLHSTTDGRRRASGLGNLRYESGNSAHGRLSAQPRARMNYAPIPVPVPASHQAPHPASHPLEHAPPIQARISQVPRRPLTATRATHRSSENAPVSHVQDPVRPPYSPPRRTSLVPHPRRPSSNANVALRGGDLSSSPVPMPVRFSVPQPPRPRDMSDRRHVHTPHPLLLPSSDDDGISTPNTLTSVPRTAAHFAVPQTTRGPRIPLRHASRQDFLSEPGIAPQLQIARRAVTPMPGPVLPFVRPSTGMTLDSASGVSSRRPVARAATARRRVDEEQENGEETERGEMGGEMEAVAWRAGIEGPSDVMEVTPPRVGRYERFLFN